MSVPKFFEKMIGLQTQKQHQKVLSYRSIVVDISTGGEPSPQDVERILAENDMSIEDLKRDVERQERRASLKVLVATIPKLEKEYDQVQHQIADANIELEEAERRHSEITNPLSFRLQDIRSAQTEAMKANQELFDGCGEPELWKQLDQTNDQLHENIAKNRELVSEISAVDRKAQNAALRADQEMSRVDIDRCRAQAVALNKRADDLRSEIKALERSNKEIQSRRNQIEKQMRAW